MVAKTIRMTGVPGIGEIRPGDDLGGMIARAVQAGGIGIEAGDVFVVAQKAVSKAEGRIVRLETVEPSAKAREWAEQNGKDARLVEVVLRESRRVLRMERGILIAETRHGFVCANAGVDASNAPPGSVVLLPEDPDRSAAILRETFEGAFGVRVGVVISDSFGRPWRQGLVNVALGTAGIAPVIDYRGLNDTFGRKLQATVIAVADELAGAAELLMGKTSGVPVVVIQGFKFHGDGSGKELLRPAELDLFR